MSHFLNSIKFVIGIDLRRKSSMKAWAILSPLKRRYGLQKQNIVNFFVFGDHINMLGIM